MASPPKLGCCLICSIASSLSSVNCCPKHLKSLKNTLKSGTSTPIFYMMSPSIAERSSSECHYRFSRFGAKRRNRTRFLSNSSLLSSSSLSSSASKSSHRKKRRSSALQSIGLRSQNDQLISFNRTKQLERRVESSDKLNDRCGQPNLVRSPLSPLLPSYSSMNINNNSKVNRPRRKSKTSSTPTVARVSEQISDETESPLQYHSPLSNDQSTNNNVKSPAYVPRIVLTRVFHVKDEGEEIPMGESQITLNMAEATEQMFAERELKPRIILKRVSLEPYNDQMDSNREDNKLCFEQLNLPSGLLLGLYAMGFRNGPSDMQALILPYSLSDQFQRNMIIQSKTGTGKTVSYIIHMLARIQTDLSSLQALIIVPTIELAITVGSGIEKMACYLSKVRTTYVTSCLQSQTTFDTPIVISTIDTVDSFRSLIDFSQLRMLIIDEIDTMVIREDYRQYLLHLFDSFPIINYCQMLVYSSTLSDQIMNFASELIPDPIVIKQRSNKQRLDNIEQYYVMCYEETKKTIIVNTILQQFNDAQIMIFCIDDETAERAYENVTMEYKNQTRVLTTQYSNEERMSLIEEFRSNSFRIFIISAQTSATTHGIDLDNVHIVINYSLPQSLGMNSDLDYVTYHQRLDRCGRYDQHGYLFNLIQSLDDWNIQLGQQKYFSFTIQQIDIEGIRTLVL